MTDLKKEVMDAVEVYVTKYLPDYLESQTSLYEKKPVKIETVLGNNKYVILLEEKDYTVTSKFTFTANETVYILKKFGETINAEDIYILPNS